MRRTWRMSLALALLAVPAGAGEMVVFHLDPRESSVQFVLDATLHKVHGTLGPASGRIAFDPGSDLATGEVEIDLTSSETGIGRRDRKMHEQTLETGRYPKAVYRIHSIDLPEVLKRGRNEIQLHGELDFHGAKHEVAVPAVAVLDGDRVTATAWIEVPYVAWGLDDPSFFILRVGKTVRVEMDVAGRIEGEVPGVTTAAAPQPR
jgi:polyisoprenoid-binding protein YceI